MCTAIFDRSHGAFFGRTLDLECSFGEEIKRLSRGEEYPFIHEGDMSCKYSIIGMAISISSQPLFYDAVNEKGLSAAALNFPRFAVYHPKKDDHLNLASFELIPYLLSQCATVGEAIGALERAVITPDSISDELRSTTLHWMIADKERAIVIESVADGLKIYDNPIGIMTNSPPFPYHKERLCDYLPLSPEHPENKLLPSLNMIPYSRGLGAYGLPGDYSSVSRFVRAAFAKEHTLLPPSDNGTAQVRAAQQRIFDILGTVALPYGIARTEKGEPIYTVYTSVIDMEKCEYCYFTHKDRSVKVFKF